MCTGKGRFPVAANSKSLWYEVLPFVFYAKLSSEVYQVLCCSLRAITHCRTILRPRR